MPRAIPRTGMSATFPIRLINTALFARGFITLPIISIPSNKSPKEKITIPMLLIFSFFKTKKIMKPTKIIG